MRNNLAQNSETQHRTQKSVIEINKIIFSASKKESFSFGILLLIQKQTEHRGC